MLQQRQNTIVKFAFILIIFGVLGLGVSIWQYFHQPKPPRAQVNPGIAAAPEPSSVKPAKQVVAEYKVAPDLPKYISIPAINLSQARIIQLGLMQNNQIAVPNNIYDAGWYNGSAKPSQQGTMFVYGHVASWTAKGLFYDLKKLKPGDTIYITRGDNTQFTYKVTGTKIYPYNKVAMDQVLAPRQKSQSLNLMTCTGEVMKGTNEYSERLVVFSAVQ